MTPKRNKSKLIYIPITLDNMVNCTCCEDPIYATTKCYQLALLKDKNITKYYNQYMCMSCRAVNDWNEI
jgi:hypothetical protein